MGNGLVSELETRLVRRKTALDYEEAEQHGENAEAAGHTAGQAKPELFMHRRYRLPQRPDVEIERMVWLSAAGRKTVP